MSVICHKLTLSCKTYECVDKFVYYILINNYASSGHIKDIYNHTSFDV